MSAQEMGIKLTRLSQLLENKTGREKLLSFFVTAGYPNLTATPELVWTLEDAGADFVELGFPFSDPMADGPTIQRSSEVALSNGVTLPLVLEQVEAIRKKSEIPIVLMSYVNPVLAYGWQQLLADAHSAGIDGFIIPDLIPEEWQSLCARHANARSFDVNFLISSVTPIPRIKLIDHFTSHFLYAVSLTGVTGARAGVPTGLTDFLQRISTEVTHPVFVGFGISRPEDACNIARYCDGVIIGSRLINLIEKNSSEKSPLRPVTTFVRDVKSALKGA